MNRQEWDELLNETITTSGGEKRLRDCTTEELETAQAQMREEIDNTQEEIDSLRGRWRHFGTVSVGMEHPADRSLCSTIEVITDDDTVTVIVKVGGANDLRLYPEEALQLAGILTAAVNTLDET